MPLGFIGVGIEIDELWFVLPTRRFGGLSSRQHGDRFDEASLWLLVPGVWAHGHDGGYLQTPTTVFVLAV